MLPLGVQERQAGGYSHFIGFDAFGSEDGEGMGNIFGKLNFPAVVALADVEVFHLPSFISKELSIHEIKKAARSISHQDAPSCAINAQMMAQ